MPSTLYVKLKTEVRSKESYRFLHDRVQEAAYYLIPQELRAEAHLRIGMAMAEHTPPDKLEEEIFEIVNQLIRGTHLITSLAERERIAQLGLVAGKRARMTTAYGSALQYLYAARGLMTEKIWDLNHVLGFSIESLIAECELHTADMAAAESSLTLLAQRARSRHDSAIVTRLRITLYTTLDRSDRAIDVFLDYLRRNGTDWPRRPARDDVMDEYNRIWSLVGDRQIEDLIDLPLLADPDVLDMLDVFTEIIHPAMFFDENLSTLVVCRLVSLCLEHGNCDASCFGYVWFGMFAGPRFNNYNDGFRFGQLGYDLVEKRNLIRYRARTYISFGTLTPWAKHARKGRELVQRASEIAYRTGDLTFSAYSWHALITNYLAVGDPLSEVQSEVEKGLDFVRKAGFGLVTENCGAQLALIRTLRGVNPTFGCFDAHDYNESDIQHRLAQNPMLALAEFFYWTRKLQARLFAGDYASAVEASRKAHQLLWPAASQVETGDFRFYAALAHAGIWNSASSDEKQEHFAALCDHHRQLEIWALHCPANFENRTALVAAEIARIEGRILDAEHNYESAIMSAHAKGFVHNEALAHELAGNFYATRGFEKIASAYLRDARSGYLRWEADGKVRQLDQLYPHLRLEEPSIGPSSTIVTSGDHLDLATVIRVSQAVSGEIVLEKLLETLMRTAIAQAGAERGLLILLRGNEPRLAAQASTEGDSVVVNQRDEALTAVSLPASVIHFGMRTREPVLLDDAFSQNPFAADEYLNLRKARSVLCLPLVNQSKLIGLLYLENNLAPRVFTPARIAVLKLVASQAAVALENARLYREVAEREAKIRRLVDANIIGTYIWKVTGQNSGISDAVIVEANDAFLQMIGYDREDLAAGVLSRTLLSAPGGRDHDAHTAVEVNATGAVLPFETDYVRKDGTRIPVLMGLAAFDERRLEGFAFAVDLTERRRAEAEAHENERRYREVQAALAHAGRVATMGQITASIAHEVSQPVSGAITNAHTALGWLSAPTPDIQEATEALNRILRDGNRAREVIERIRALARKAPARRDVVELNEAVREVIELTRNQATKNHISVRLSLADGLPVVLGDRVQLQQVILNLIVNAIESMIETSDGPRELLVSTRNETMDRVLVVVQDSGPGLTDATFGRIFDPFHTTKPTGMGLGLSICRSIVETHGGRLWASANEPHGAVLQFSLPVAAGC
ncbi:MAG: ATP-binding protein [Bryobacteraceae bacterium]